VTYQEEVERLADIFGIVVQEGENYITAYPPMGYVFDASYLHFADAPLHEDIEDTYSILKDLIGTGILPCADPDCTSCGFGI